MPFTVTLSLSNWAEFYLIMPFWKVDHIFILSLMMCIRFPLVGFNRVRVSLSTVFHSCSPLPWHQFVPSRFEISSTSSHIGALKKIRRDFPLNLSDKDKISTSSLWFPHPLLPKKSTESFGSGENGCNNHSGWHLLRLSGPWTSFLPDMHINREKNRIHLSFWNKTDFEEGVVARSPQYGQQEALLMI